MKKRTPVRPPAMKRYAISIPPMMHLQMQMHPEVNWSSICREALAEALSQLNKESRYGSQ